MTIYKAFHFLNSTLISRHLLHMIKVFLLLNISALSKLIRMKSVKEMLNIVSLIIPLWCCHHVLSECFDFLLNSFFFFFSRIEYLYHFFFSISVSVLFA